jgi:hypothetical protein
VRETKLDPRKRTLPVDHADTPIVQTPTPEPHEVGGDAKTLVQTGHVTRRKARHQGTTNLPHGPWHTKTPAEKAEAAWEEQMVLGDRPVVEWQRKVAQLHAHPEISGSVGGVGVGDVVDRLHEGLQTANTLIRSFDLEDERFARAEFGAAPSPICRERVEQVADKELARLFELGTAQVEQGFRKAPQHPLVKDRALFALGRAAAISEQGGEVWFALKYLPKPGAQPEQILVHAKLEGDDFATKKTAIEMLGINLLHGAYFHPPGELIDALHEGLPKGIATIDFIDSKDVHQGSAPSITHWKDTEPPHAEVGRDRRALHKAQALNDRGKCSGVIAEIGASQLVAELFRRANGSKQTLLERKSNYGMEMSALAYGKTARAVSKERLLSMLDNEFTQFSERAKTTNLEGRKLFAYANTVATSSDGKGAGWLGIDFQTEPGGPKQRIVLHARLTSKEVPDQELALKTLGINLIHAAELHLDPTSHGMQAFLHALTEGLPPGSISIDHIETDLKQWSDDALRLTLLETGQTDALLFTASGERMPTLDHFYKRTYVVKPDRDPKDANLVHLDLLAFHKHGTLDQEHLLARVADLNAEGRDVILTRHSEMRDLIQILADSANTQQTVVLTRAQMRRLLDPKQWIKVEGGMEGVLGKLTGETLKLEILPGNDPIAPSSAAGKRMLEQLRSRGVC